MSFTALHFLWHPVHGYLCGSYSINICEISAGRHNFLLLFSVLLEHKEDEELRLLRGLEVLDSLLLFWQLFFLLRQPLMEPPFTPRGTG